jgi:type I restriction enzyme M protein
MLTAETKRRLDACRDILVGKLPLPTDQIELITLALIYKFMDDLDEESVRLGGKRSFFTGPLEKYRWRALLPQNVSADERMNLFAAGLEVIGKAEHLPALFRDIFRNSFLKFRDGRILTLFLNEVNAFEYSHSEELGNAFEYLLKTMGIQAENGQFRTPRHIINFMVECLDPQPNDRILDPACGTGGFLVSSYKHILAQHTSPGSKIPGDKLTHDQRQKVYSNLTGYDVTDLMVKLSKVNLFLHGFPDPAIHIYDTLTNDARWNEKADLILANPPFMTPKGGVSPHTKFRVAAKKSEVLFTDYIAEHLTPDGRGAVIVPNGIVATTQNAYVKLRKFLVEDSLVAVISLPAGVFNPYSGVKTSILFLDKKLSRKIDKILFLKIKADGFDLGAQRREISENDLPEAERLLKMWFKEELGDKAESRVAWKPVDKNILLPSRSVSLQAEQFLGGGPLSIEIETARLGDVCERCQQVNPASLGKPTFRYIDIDSIDNSSLRIAEAKAVYVADAPSRARKLLKFRDVLFSTVRPYLKNIAIVPPQLDSEIASTGFGVLRANESRALPEYLFAVVSDQRFVDAANALTTGASYPAITEKQLFDLEIPLPPLEEQQRIVTEIEAYQKIIDGSRQILASYQPNLQIDAEWEMRPLGDIAEVKLGKMLDKNKHRSGRMIPYLRNVNVRWGTIETDDLLEMYFDDDELDRFGLAAGDVLVCEGGEPGRAAVWDGRIAEMKYQKALHRVRFTIPYEPKLLVYFLQALSKTREWENRFHGATIKHFTREMFIELPVPVPPIEEQRRIVAELQAETAEIDAVRALIPRYQTKIDNVLNRVWAASTSDTALNAAA